VHKSPSYQLQISGDLNVGFAHICHILEKLERFGWVTSEKRGRIKLFTLTEKGNEIAKELSSVKLKMGII